MDDIRMFGAAVREPLDGAHRDALAAVDAMLEQLRAVKNQQAQASDVFVQMQSYRQHFGARFKQLYDQSSAYNGAVARHLFADLDRLVDSRPLDTVVLNQVLLDSFIRRGQLQVAHTFARDAGIAEHFVLSRMRAMGDFHELVAHLQPRGVDSSETKQESNNNNNNNNNGGSVTECLAWALARLEAVAAARNALRTPASAAAPSEAPSGEAKSTAELRRSSKRKAPSSVSIHESSSSRSMFMHAMMHHRNIDRPSSAVGGMRARRGRSRAQTDSRGDPAVPLENVNDMRTVCVEMALQRELRQLHRLVFCLRKIEFLMLLTGERQPGSAPERVARALTYARTQFGRQRDRESATELQELMGCLAFGAVLFHPSCAPESGGQAARLLGNPFPHLLEPPRHDCVHGGVLVSRSLWHHAQQQFHTCFSRTARVPAQDPLLVAFEAASRSIPRLHKYLQLAQLTGDGDDVARRLQGVELDLGEDLQFHSTFVCPVSKEQTSQEGGNRAMLLKCGHAISSAALDKIATSSRSNFHSTFKCPYCPVDQRKSDALQLTFSPHFT